MSTFLIGEIASAHDNDWAKVEALVECCASAGFSACKLQYWSDADRLADRRHATPYYRDIYRKYAIPKEWLPDFRLLSHAHGMEAVVTVYIHEDVAVVAPWADRLKLAAFENSDRTLLNACTATGKPVIVSSGMMTAAERDDLIALAEQRGNIAVLGCVSSYPASLDGALGMMCDWMRLRVHGYSDHTRNVWTGAVAVGCGAQIIEVHVRAYDTDPENPDYATALDPDEFRFYAQGVRTAERLIADVLVDESAMRKFKVRSE